MTRPVTSVLDQCKNRSMTHARRPHPFILNQISTGQSFLLSRVTIRGHSFPVHLSNINPGRLSNSCSILKCLGKIVEYPETFRLYLEPLATNGIERMYRAERWHYFCTISRCSLPPKYYNDSQRHYYLLKSHYSRLQPPTLDNKAFLPKHNGRQS